MRIHSLCPDFDQGHGSNKTLARFSVDLGPLSLHNLVLKQKPDGTYRTVPMNLRGQAVASLNPDLARSITAAALVEWRASAHVQSRN